MRSSPPTWSACGTSARPTFVSPPPGSWESRGVQVHWRDLCGCRDDAKGVAGRVNAAVFLGEVEGPVLVEVAIGDQRAECQDRLGAGEAPAGAGDVHAVFDEVAAGAF